MGTVIKFPDDGRIVRFGREAGESATIIILPVIRIERYPDSFDGISRNRSRPPQMAAGGASGAGDEFIAPTPRETVRCGRAIILLRLNPTRCCGQHLACHRHQARFGRQSA